MKKIIALFVAALMLLGCAGVCEAAAYNFADQAQTYMEYIGQNLHDRNITAEGAEVDPENVHQQTIEWIVGELKNAGYTDEQIEVTSDQATSRNGEYTFPIANIILTVEGQQTDKQIVVGGHYDGDGTGDNGSGVALLLSTAVGLYGQQPLYTVKYVFFDGEEYGLFGSSAFAESMTEEEVAATAFMVNMDALAFGDYCNVYGGVQDDETQTVSATDAYDLAMATAAKLGINTCGTAELDGYYAANGAGPEPAENTLYTNPWTYANPAPMNGDYASPTTGFWSDHAPFVKLGIPYLYLEATNWFAAGDGGEDAYTGYFETIDSSLGYDGMFMNTEFDTLENLNNLFPGRSLAHFNVFSPLLCALVMNPVAD